MGKRGPPPTPTALLRLSGGWRGTYTNRNEPEPEKGRPRCPVWLDEYAKAVWKQLVPQLDAMGVLAKIDGHALTVLCQTWSRWRKAVEFIQENGETYAVKDEAGRVKYLKKFPQATVIDSSARTLNRFMQEFGLTPSARTRIEVPGQAQGDGAEGKATYLNLG